MKFDLVPSVTRQWRRRWFLSSLGGLGLWGWLASRDALAARPARAPAAQAAARAPASWVLFLDHLIPADELSPSASGLQVDRQLWSEVRQDAEYQGGRRLD